MMESKMEENLERTVVDHVMQHVVSKFYSVYIGLIRFTGEIDPVTGKPRRKISDGF